MAHSMAFGFSYACKPVSLATARTTGLRRRDHRGRRHSLGRLPRRFLRGHNTAEWLILALLTLASASSPIRLHSIPVPSRSQTFVFTSSILFGPSAGTLTVALDAAVISFWSFRQGQTLYKIVFNVCALPLTIWIAAHLFFAGRQLPAALRHSRAHRPSTTNLAAPALHNSLLLAEQLGHNHRHCTRATAGAIQDLARQLCLDFAQLLRWGVNRRLDCQLHSRPQLCVLGHHRASFAIVGRSSMPHTHAALGAFKMQIATWSNLTASTYRL